MTIHLPLGLPARQAQFLCLLATRPSLTRADYQSFIGVSHNTAQRDLAELAAAHLVCEIGTARGRRYALGPAALRRAESGEQLVAASPHLPPTLTITIDPLSLPMPTA